MPFAESSTPIEFPSPNSTTTFNCLSPYPSLSNFQLPFANPPPICLVSAAAAEARKWDYANVVTLTKRVGAALGSVTRP